MQREAVRRRLDDLVFRYREVRAGIERDTRLHQAVHRLAAFQAARLARTYADLRQLPRYRPAVDFFLSDLYGPQDLTARDEQLLRALDRLKRLLPAAALDALSRAFELHVMSLELDARTAASTGAAAPIDDAAYAAAYRAAGEPAKRERQLVLIGEIGSLLDRLAAHREVGLALRLARGPATAAGYGDLQHFLERGYDAFRRLDGAGSFLAAIDSRERELMQRLFAGADDLEPRVPPAR